MRENEVAIIGAGPAGLTAAFELSKHGIRGTMYEASNSVGGISRTEVREGYRFDLGGHRFFSKSAEVNELWSEMLREPLQLRPRLSRVYYGDKFYDYPLKASNALRNMGMITAMSCLLSYAGAKIKPIENPKSFEEWVTNQFGQKLYLMFFKTYTEKVWGIPCSEIGADWAAQRIKGLSLGEAVKNAILGSSKKSTVKTLIEEFKYPRLGPGQLWEDCAKSVEESGWQIVRGAKVTGVTVEGGKIVAVAFEKDGETASIPCEKILSTMPLRELVFACGDSVPNKAIEAAGELKYRDFITVSLVLDAENIFPDNWIYVHSPEVRLGRIQNFKNWSKDLVPDSSKTCLGLEYFCNEGDDLWNASDDSLIELGYKELKRVGLANAELVRGWVVRVQKAYPVYDTGYAERLDCLREWSNTVQGLYCIGRNGQHRYNNMDHSMMTALIASRNIALGHKMDPWAVNEDAEYQETEKVQG